MTLGGKRAMGADSETVITAYHVAGLVEVQQERSDAVRIKRK
jgi:hypothetical protein